ncbi:tetratricopeptide repeat protein [Mesorhizobium sp. RCC_202]|uniref:tetratricopeptide repeat protein n=1 Tax=Mesorhizobium sp. RCC_202 TaxID=3239222 RepID=UPI0035239B9F
MRILFAFFTVLLLSGTALPAGAEVVQGDLPPDAAPPAATPPPAAPTKQGRLDQLFTELKRERNEKAAERIAGRIWNEWNQSGSASIDLMMQWAQKATQDQKFDVALDFLDQVVTLQPDYAEGWNRRATVHFMMKNYGKSMADIDRTLQLEPRHFGALSGLAQIMTETGHKQSALEAWQKVLAIYPMMRSAQDQVSAISEELAGEGI